MIDSLKPLLNELDHIISKEEELILTKSTIINYFNQNEKRYIAFPFEEFYDNLTNKEIKAVNSILKRVQNEGDVSISVLIAETSLSRPVYISLLSKLKDYNMAEVSNRGVKGTHIKFLNSNLICGKYLEEHQKEENNG